MLLLSCHGTTATTHSRTTGGVERAYNICLAQQSARFPQVDLGHFVLKYFISPKYSSTRITADISIQID